MISIFAPHFFNWTEQLRDSGHEVHWLDVYDSNTVVQKIDFVNQIYGWRYRKNFKGRYFLKKKARKFNELINLINERKLTAVLENTIRKIRPDVIHSFVIYLAGVPILPVMDKFPTLKWVLSTWGSDLYYYRRHPDYLEGIKQVLSHVDYLFTDCKRDHQIAIENGFQGKFLGVYPGGGGFDLEKMEQLSLPFEKRYQIVIKGYQGKHGKCIEVLKAIVALQNEYQPFEIIVFGAAQEVFDFVNESPLRDWNNFTCLGNLPHDDVLKLLGASLIYVGNSSSDGMPNTLLEAIVMGAYPIQSNPGGATEEVIKDGKNGLLIRDPENIKKIKDILKRAISGMGFLHEGIDYNLKNIKPCLERKRIRNLVLEQYQKIETELN